MKSYHCAQTKGAIKLAHLEHLAPGEACEKPATRMIAHYFPKRYDQPSRHLYLCPDCARSWDNLHPLDRTEPV